MSTYLATWYDPGLEVAPGDTLEAIAQAEVDRLVRLALVAEAALTIPRRVGGDAGKEDLASDKRRCRRVRYVAEELLKDWGTKPKVKLKPDEIKREAAIINWSRWYADHALYLQQRLRYVATMCVKNGADERACKSTLVKLNNELRWLENALRD